MVCPHNGTAVLKGLSGRYGKNLGLRDQEEKERRGGEEEEKRRGGDRAGLSLTIRYNATATSR